MSQATSAPPRLERPLPVARSFGQTSRKDNWWIPTIATFIGLTAFIVYATWAAFQGNHYRFGNYLSPFYSPELFGPPPHAWFGDRPAWWPGWIPWSGAFFILWGPGGFRFTCYYYRGAYYKSHWADPMSCAVGEPRSSYRGEAKFPLILQNIHRYFMYLALVFIVLLAIDFYHALWFIDPVTGAREFGVGVGSLVMLVNVFLLGGYTFGCHSLRHLVGGRLVQISKHPARKKTYDFVSMLNRNHMKFAWFSLFWVGFTDVYVRLCSMGIWTDFRLF
jgi:hypothetical protein